MLVIAWGEKPRLPQELPENSELDTMYLDTMRPQAVRSVWAELYGSAHTWTINLGPVRFARMNGGDDGVDVGVEFPRQHRLNLQPLPQQYLQAGWCLQRS